MFKKVNGYYWAKSGNGSKVGYTTLNKLFVGEFYYGWLAIVFLSSSALITLSVAVAQIIEKII